MSGRRVLIVEDDDAMCAALRAGFESEGYEVALARDGEAALGLAAARAPDLVLLDVMLPRRSGLDVLKHLRRAGDRVPVILVTARGQEMDKVVGLKLGADDYVTKPFGFMELLARVEAVLRRSGEDRPAPPPPPVHRFGDVEVDLRRREARKAGAAVDLAPREFDLLAFFLAHRGELVTREQLLDAVWGYHHIPLTRTVDVHVAKLRKKLEDRPSSPVHLLTVHRQGYRFTG